MAIIQCIINFLKLRRSPFSYNYHHRINSQTKGLYVFWLHNCCLYVGKSEDIKCRMYRHRMTEHNRKLERYFKTFSKDIEVSYFVLPDKSDAELRRLERKAIRLLRPVANIAQTT